MAKERGQNKKTNRRNQRNCKGNGNIDHPKNKLFKNGARPLQCYGINRNGVNNEQRTKVKQKVNNNAKGVSISKKGIIIKIYYILIIVIVI